MSTSIPPTHEDPAGPSPGQGGRRRPAWVVPFALVTSLVLIATIAVAAALGSGRWRPFASEQPSPNGSASATTGTGPTGGGATATLTPSAPTRAMTAAEWRAQGPCGLLTTKEVAQLGRTSLAGDAEPLTPLSRRVEVSAYGKSPAEICGFGGGRYESQPLTIQVSKGGGRFNLFGKGEDIERLGDDATITGRSGWYQVVVERGDDRLTIGYSSIGEKSSEKLQRARMTSLARFAFARLPAAVTMDPLLATGQCAKVDTQVVGKALKDEVAYSRSIQSAIRARCEFAGKSGATIAITYQKQVGGRDLRQLQNYRQRVVVEGVDAFWEDYEGLSLTGGGALVRVSLRDYRSARQTEASPQLLALGKASATVFGVRKAKPPKPDPNDPCAMLSPADAAELQPRADKDTLPIVARSVELIGGVPVDTCAYDESVEPYRPSVVVSVAEKGFEPLTELEQDGKKLPISGLGDKAFLVRTTSDTIVIVEKAGRHLVIRANVPSDSSETKARARIERAARAALARMPAKFALGKLKPYGPCAKVDLRAVARAAGEEFVYSRSVANDADSSCTFTSAQGSQVKATVEAVADGYDTQYARKSGTKLNEPGMDAVGVPYRGIMVFRGQAAMKVTSRSAGESEFRGAREPGARLIAIAKALQNGLLD